MSYIDLSRNSNDIKLGVTTPDLNGVSYLSTQTPLSSGIFSGQITVTSSGVAVQGTDNAWSAFYIKAHPDNTDSVWVGNDGSNDVTNLNGFPLNSGESIYVAVTNLNQLWFDSDVNGGKICWHRG